LFREHVFQPIGESGSVVVDFGHVVECLNKLDLGTEERVALVARDNATVLVAAYKELKLASEAAFKQLVSSKPASSPTSSSSHAPLHSSTTAATATAAAAPFGGRGHGTHPRPYSPSSSSSLSSSFASAASLHHLPT
jgi:hypothetical protein